MLLVPINSRETHRVTVRDRVKGDDEVMKLTKGSRALVCLNRVGTNTLWRTQASSPSLGPTWMWLAQDMWSPSATPSTPPGEMKRRQDLQIQDASQSTKGRFFFTASRKTGHGTLDNNRQINTNGGFVFNYAVVLCSTQHSVTHCRTIVIIVSSTISPLFLQPR